MSKYIFILGSSPELASQEIVSFLDLNPNKISNISQNIIITESPLDYHQLINILGGTVKIADILETIDDLDKLSPAKWQGYFGLNAPAPAKLTFGFSLYSGTQTDYQTILKSALAFKKYLKSLDQPARVVTGQDPELSSVIVTKNNLLGRELLVIKHKDKWLLGLTQAVQDFAKYQERDIARPRRDARSGMLPPKVARMMINLAGPDYQKTILDPFCGSGTILQEAYTLGFSNILGRDISPKAISDSKANLDWLIKNNQQPSKLDIKPGDVQDLTHHVAGPIDLIVSEPFMGDSRKMPTKDTVQNLQNLYKSAFQQFFKILAKNGQVVFIFPIFKINNTKIPTLNLADITSCGFKLKTPTIVYSRADQRVLREIAVFTKLDKPKSN